MPEDNKNVIETALQAAQKPFLQLAPNGLPVVYAPFRDGQWEFFERENFLNAPIRKIGSVNLHETQSFIKFVQREKQPGTQIYINADFGRGDIKVTAVINGNTPTEAGWSDYRATYSAGNTPAAAKWLRSNNTKQHQSEFSSSLTELAKYIVSENPGNSNIQYPSAAEVLDFCLNLEYTEKTTFKSGYREQDGRMNFTFITEDTKSEKNIKAFEKFGIEFTPFIGGESYFVEALLKYRVDKNNGALILWYELQNISTVIESAARDIAAKLEAAFSDIPVYFGEPA